ncbi:MAG TPA: hypothetical protein VJL89_03205 [Thermodesulfovibrionia bacterium]|nr:hypothetical protein [Thermodesulfovibrionia bacterium]
MATIDHIERLMEEIWPAIDVEAVLKEPEDGRWILVYDENTPVNMKDDQQQNQKQGSKQVMYSYINLWSLFL